MPNELIKGIKIAAKMVQGSSEGLLLFVVFAVSSTVRVVLCVIGIRPVDMAEAKSAIFMITTNAVTPITFDMLFTKYVFGLSRF